MFIQSSDRNGKQLDIFLTLINAIRIAAQTPTDVHGEHWVTMKFIPLVIILSLSNVLSIDIAKATDMYKLGLTLDTSLIVNLMETEDFLTQYGQFFPEDKKKISDAAYNQVKAEAVVESNPDDVITKLLTNTASNSVADHSQKQAIVEAALESNHDDVITKLLTNTASNSVADHSQKQAIVEAALESNHDDVITKLLTNTASSSVADHSQKQAIVEAALESNHDDVITKLLTNTASNSVADHSYNQAIAKPALKSNPAEVITKVLADYQVKRKYTVLRNATTKGGDMVVDKEGYRFVQRKRNREEVIKSWRCQKFNYGCKVQLSEELGVFSSNSEPHTHPAEPAVERSITVRNRVKQRATMDMYVPPDEIVMSEVRMDDVQFPHGPVPSSAKPLNMKRNIQRLRGSKREPHPTSLYFTMQPYPSFLQKDMWVNHDEGVPHRHMVFCTEAQLELLKDSKLWCMDGTFKIVRTPFKQLFTINVFIGDQVQVPAVFVIMSGKSTRDYEEVLKIILELMQERNWTPEVKGVMSDFETGLWPAVRRVLPQVKHIGCLFHFRQSIWRRISQTPDLIALYGCHEPTMQFCKRVMALAILPEERIEQDAIPALLDQLETLHQSCRELMQYMENTWLHRIPDWCVFGLTVRTNNSVEGWHNKLNRKCAKGRLVLWELIAQLVDISSQLPSTKKMLESNIKTNTVNKKYVAADRVLRHAWQQYRETGDWQRLWKAGAHCIKY